MSDTQSFLWHTDREIADLVKSIQKLYSLAEAEITKASNIYGDLEFIPVNQLRYSGRHLVDSLNQENKSDCLEELRKSEAHCKRALFDTYDVVLDFYLRSIRLLFEDYAAIDTNSILKNEVDIRKFIYQAPEDISEFKINTERRSEYYEQIKIIRDQAGEYFLQLQASIPILNKEVQRHNDQVKQNNAIITGGRIAAIATVGLFILAALTYFRPNTPASSSEVSPKPADTKVTACSEPLKNHTPALNNPPVKSE